MKIGDKVRMLRGSEEGVITRFLEKNLIEIEIEDGFGIPVLRSDVVVVAQEEKNYFEKPERATSRPSMADESTTKPQQQGIYFAHVAINDKQLSLHLVNATDFELPFSVGEDAQGDYRGINAGLLSPQGTVKLKNVQIAEFDQWPTLIVQLIFHRTGYFTLREPLQRRVQFKANTFFKSKATAPVLNKPAFVFRIDEQTGKPLDPEKLKESMFMRQEEQGVETPISQLERPPREVDLHIEKLTSAYDTMSNPEMLELQLKIFEEKLDQAIATGMDEITFIHGVGSGVLRDAIHKRLSKIKNINYFQDSMRDKFGYGATRVQIK
ncbi:Smr/MutS family protein [Tunicatimonas pelagia]|uniref:Smr/MutS family protein n=1 Tax=Tunicatimonas pelagia TaxID=931531 RepID=UPI00266686D3|nr:Smr/MutS family protein [Tunicatimonas pelagia]WKN41436.1 Smr/MutS family protein [Tunicatimonas pelagia]